MWELNYILNDLASLAFVIGIMVYIYGERQLYSLGSRRMFFTLVRSTCAYTAYACILDFTRIFDPLGIPAWMLELAFFTYVLATQLLAVFYVIYIVSDASSNASSTGLSRSSLVVSFLMLVPVMVLLVSNLFTGDLYSIVADVTGRGMLVTGPLFRLLFLIMIVEAILALMLVIRDSGFLQPQMRRAGGYACIFTLALLMLQFAFTDLQLMSITFSILLFFCFVVMTTSTFLVDATTGLGNAKMLFSSLGYYFSREDEFCVVSIELVDYDRLVRDLDAKMVEDLVNMFSARLSTVDGMMQVFRVEEDRFVIIGPPPSSRTCRRFIMDVLDIAGEEYAIGALTYSPKSRVFMIPCPAVSSSPDDVFDMLRYFTPARIALLDIGKSYYSIIRERYSFFVCDLRIRQDMERRRDIVEMLKEACQEDLFEVAFQPMFDRDGRFLDMAECLVRLYDRKRERYVSPVEFIPIAEAEGYIDQITSSVLLKACRMIRHFGECGHRLTLSLNFSSRQIFSRRLMDSVVDTIGQEGVDPGSIKIEITENDMIEDFDAVRSMMDEYRSRGVGFFLDDFGSGYASISRYINLPFECVKMDRSFMLKAHEDQRIDALLRAMVGCFHLLEFSVVFEGVENDDQLAYVRSFEGDMAIQGFRFSPPLDFGSFCRSAGVEPVPQDGPLR